MILGSFYNQRKNVLTKCVKVLHDLDVFLRFIHKSDASFYYNIFHIVAITYLHLCTYEYMHLL